MDYPDALAARLDNLARAKDCEAAALLDVRDFREAEAEWTARRIKAEKDARYATERVANAKLALSILCEQITDRDLEAELDPAFISGPEQSDLAR